MDFHCYKNLAITSQITQFIEIVQQFINKDPLIRKRLFLSAQYSLFLILDPILEIIMYRIFLFLFLEKKNSFIHFKNKLKPV